MPSLLGAVVRQGIRHEDFSGRDIDRWLAHFVRSKGPGARRRCGAGCGIGRGGAGTRRRGGGRAHRLCRRALDRALLGSAALRLTCASAANIANEYGARGADHRQCSFAAACQTFRASTRHQAAAGSGAGIDRTTQSVHFEKLTRRTNHRHIESIARSRSKASAGKPVAGFFGRAANDILQRCARKTMDKCRAGVSAGEIHSFVVDEFKKRGSNIHRR